MLRRLPEHSFYEGGERMTTEAEPSVADCLAQVLDYLGIERAHFAASMLADVTGLVQAHPERIASLTRLSAPP
jgi:hypothetical protein